MAEDDSVEGGFPSSEDGSEEPLTVAIDRLAERPSHLFSASYLECDSDEIDSPSPRQESLPPGEMKCEPPNLGERPVDVPADSTTLLHVTSNTLSTPPSKLGSKWPTVPHSTTSRDRRHEWHPSLDLSRIRKDEHRGTSGGSIAHWTERPSSDVSPMLSFADIMILHSSK